MRHGALQQAGHYVAEAPQASTNHTRHTCPALCHCMCVPNPTGSCPTLIRSCPTLVRSWQHVHAFKAHSRTRHRATRRHAASSTALSLSQVARILERGAHLIQCPPDHAASWHCVEQQCADSQYMQVRHLLADGPRRNKPHHSHGERIRRGCAILTPMALSMYLSRYTSHSAQFESAHEPRRSHSVGVVIIAQLAPCFMSTFSILWDAVSRSFVRTIEWPTQCL